MANMTRVLNPSIHEMNNVNRKGTIRTEWHKALVICWKKTGMDSFFIQYDWGRKRLLGRLQANNSKIPKGEQFPIIQLAKWYRIEYSRYVASDYHIIIHSFCEAKEEEKESIETRVIGKNVEFKLFFRKKKSADNYFVTCSEGIEVIEVPQEEQERLGFIAWCTLKAEKGDGFRFALKEIDEKRELTNEIEDDLERFGY